MPLIDRGQQDVAVLGGRDAAVGVDPDRVDALVLGGLQATEAGGTGDREDDVSALLDQALGDRLALGLVVEGVREGPSLAVPAEQLDVGLPLSAVVLLDALAEALHEDRDGRDVEATEGADDAGLRHRRGEVAGEVGGLARC